MNAQTRRLRQIRDSKFRAWIIWQVFTPFLAIVCCWPAAWLMFNVGYSFHRSFVGGELYLLGTLLCIGIVVEIWAEKVHRTMFPDKTSQETLDKIFHRSLLIACFYFAAFLFARLTASHFDFPTESSIDPKHPFEMPLAITVAAVGSLLGGIFAMGWSYLITIQTYAIFLKAEIFESRATTIRPRKSSP